jgi:hypothetical protein
MRPTIERFRTLPIRAIALLLILQAVLFIGGAVWFTLPILDNDALLELAASTDTEDLNTLPPNVVQATQALLLFLFPVLAIPAFVAACGFLFLWNSGWVLAMLTQIVALLISLFLYIFFKPVTVVPIPWLLYVFMASSIFMVIFLNVSDVRIAFQRKPKAQVETA